MCSIIMEMHSPTENRKNTGGLISLVNIDEIHTKGVGIRLKKSLVLFSATVSNTSSAR